MRHITLLVILAATPLTNIRAQDSLPVTVGDRVRVTAPALDVDKYDGTIQALTDDTLVVERQQPSRRGSATAATLRVAFTSVTRLAVRVGSVGRVLKDSSS